MVERSQKDVWRLTPWLMVALLLVNFVMMAVDARDINSGQRVVRSWTQTIPALVQSPVTTVTASVSNYFSSIANLRSAQDENTSLKKQFEKLKLQFSSKEGVTSENQGRKALPTLTHPH